VVDSEPVDWPLCETGADVGGLSAAEAVAVEIAKNAPAVATRKVDRTTARASAPEGANAEALVWSIERLPERSVDGVPLQQDASGLPGCPWSFFIFLKDTGQDIGFRIDRRSL
jgi:hypothetical protein